MTTTGPAPMTDDPSAGTRRLRRSATDRVGAGVAGGLGEYFGLDPVLFRVLFATAAFFGGAGVLAYLLAWAIMPDAGTGTAAVDGWATELRRRNVPPWLIAVVAGVALWALAFSWWAPGPFVPVVAAVVLVVVAFGRRDLQRPSSPDAGTPGAPSPTVDLRKRDEPSNLPVLRTGVVPAVPGDATQQRPGEAPQPAWLREGRTWLDEARAASRARARRALPVKIATLVVLAGALITLGLVDSAVGVPLNLYFWFGLGILVAGLLVGLALRRTPWSVLPLTMLAALGVVAFAGTAARFGDGVGHTTWRPTSTLASDYRLAFGQGTLDLRALPEQTSARTVHVRLAAGQVRILAPDSMNVVVHAHVRAGSLRLRPDVDGSDHSGLDFDRIVEPLAVSTGAPVTVDVDVAEGQVSVER